MNGYGLAEAAGAAGFGCENKGAWLKSTCPLDGQTVHWSALIFSIKFIYWSHASCRAILTRG